MKRLNSTHLILCIGVSILLAGCTSRIASGFEPFVFLFGLALTLVGCKSGGLFIYDLKPTPSPGSVTPSTPNFLAIDASGTYSPAAGSVISFQSGKFGDTGVVSTGPGTCNNGSDTAVVNLTGGGNRIKFIDYQHPENNVPANHPGLNGLEEQFCSYPFEGFYNTVQVTFNNFLPNNDQIVFPNATLCANMYVGNPGQIYVYPGAQPDPVGNSNALTLNFAGESGTLDPHNFTNCQ